MFFPGEQPRAEPFIHLDLMMMMMKISDSSVLQVIESTQELGNDLAGVMALQRKLTGMERDLVAIEDKLGDLGKEAERLASEHPDQSQTIKGRLAEITHVWDEMKVPGRWVHGRFSCLQQLN